MSNNLVRIVNIFSYLFLAVSLGALCASCQYIGWHWIGIIGIPFGMYAFALGRNQRLYQERETAVMLPGGIINGRKAEFYVTNYRANWTWLRVSGAMLIVSLGLWLNEIIVSENFDGWSTGLAAFIVIYIGLSVYMVLSQIKKTV